MSSSKTVSKKVVAKGSVRSVPPAARDILGPNHEQETDTEMADHPVSEDELSVSTHSNVTTIPAFTFRSNKRPLPESPSHHNNNNNNNNNNLGPIPKRITKSQHSSIPASLLEQALDRLQLAAQMQEGKKLENLQEIIIAVERVIKDPETSFPFSHQELLHKQMQKIATEVGKNTKAIAAITSTQPIFQSSLPMKKKPVLSKLTYAQVATIPGTASSTTTANTELPSNSNDFITVTRKKTIRKEERTQLQEKKLVLVTNKEDDMQDFNALLLRNQINDKFTVITQDNKPVIASITRSRTKENIVLTTTEHFDADFLTQHNDIWIPFFKFQRHEKIEN